MFGIEVGEYNKESVIWIKNVNIDKKYMYYMNTYDNKMKAQKLCDTQDKLDKIEKQVQEMSYKISDLAEKYDHEYSRDTWNSLQNIVSELDNFYITAKHLIETFRRDHINL